MDPKEVQEKAIPLKVISLIECIRDTEIQQATGQLITSAYFYACSSCEYLKVQGLEDKKTKQLTLGNLAFYKHNKEYQIPPQISAQQTDSPSLSRHRKMGGNSTPSHSGKQTTPSSAQLYSRQR
jgi:hypothetical protein